jgi:hypothetical protein
MNSKAYHAAIVVDVILPKVDTCGPASGKEGEKYALSLKKPELPPHPVLAVHTT